MSLLSIENLCVEAGPKLLRTPVVKDYSLNIESGQILGLVGESGAGKSMIAKAILDLLPENAKITNGSILFNGQSIFKNGKHQLTGIRGKQISLIPQDPMVSLNPIRKIGDQLIDGIRADQNQSKEQAKLTSRDLLSEVLIKQPKLTMDAYAHELSGGMRQRVLIAMAFANQPKLIIADEATTALDVTVQKRVLGIIRRLQKQFFTSLVFITHDLGIVAKLCDQVNVLYKGESVEYASAEEIYHNPQHPYTQSLLASMPRYDQPERGLVIPAADTVTQG